MVAYSGAGRSRDIDCNDACAPSVRAASKIITEALPCRSALTPGIFIITLRYLECYSLARATLNAVGHERGSLNEAKVELALMNQELRPGWIVGGRRGTKAEDREGKDFIVETDVGHLFLQVKSSRSGKEEFLKKHQRGNVAVVVISHGDLAEVVHRKTIAALGESRDRYLAIRARTQKRRHE